MKKHFTPAAQAIQIAIISLHLLTSPLQGLGITTAKRTRSTTARNNTMTTTQHMTNTVNSSNGIAQVQLCNTSSATRAASNNNSRENQPKRTANGISPRHKHGDHTSMEKDGSPGPTNQRSTEAKISSSFIGEKIKNASVNHCSGEDTEEAVAVTFHDKAPVLERPIEPPERDKQQHNEIRFSDKEGRRLRPHRGARMVNDVPLTISSLNQASITSSKVTQPPGPPPGASTFTVMQEGSTEGFEAAALYVTFAVEMLSGGEMSTRPWDVWKRYAPRPALRNKVGAKGHE